MKIREMAGKYDRSLIAIAVSIATLLTIWMKVGDSADAILERSKVVQALKLENAKQEEFNKNLLNELTEIKKDLRFIRRSR